jgi:hypothetical protein
MIWLILIAGLGVLVAATLVVTGLFGMKVSPERLGVLTLRNSLRSYDVDSDYFSEKCLEELARIGTLTFREKSTSTEFVSNIETTALVVASICFGESGCTPAKFKEESEMGCANAYWEVLAEHDPKRFALDRLEKTQAINAMLRAEKWQDQRDQAARARLPNGSGQPRVP